MTTKWSRRIGIGVGVFTLFGVIGALTEDDEAPTEVQGITETAPDVGATEANLSPTTTTTVDPTHAEMVVWASAYGATDLRAVGDGLIAISEVSETGNLLLVAAECRRFEGVVEDIKDHQRAPLPDLAAELALAYDYVYQGASACFRGATQADGALLERSAEYVTLGGDAIRRANGILDDYLAGQ
jgi:hypothetical protein